MKREDVKANIPGITEEQLNWLMNENGADINREKAAATALQAQLENANAQLKTAQEGLAKFDGVDVAALNAQIAKLQSDMKEQADGFAFDTALDGAIRDAHGRSVKAIRALLDVDTLKGSKDRTSDIQKAIAAAKESDPWAFESTSTNPAASVGKNSGAEHGGTNNGGEKSLSDTILSAMGL